MSSHGSLPADVVEREFIDEIGSQYLANTQAPDMARVRAWRPRSAMALLNRLHAPVTGLARQQGLTDGARMVWLEGGRRGAEPVLLVHGFGATKENWLPLLPFISKRFHVFIIDLPGWGESAFRAETCYGMDEQVRRLASWLDQRKLKPVHVVGSSMGGCVAGLLAARHPDLVRSVTLMNAAGVAGEETTAFEQGLAQGRNGLIAHNMRGAYRLLSTVMSNRWLAAAIAPMACWDLIARRHVNEHMFRHLLMFVPAPELASFTDIRSPAFIMWGVDDAVIHVSAAATFQQLIPHAQQKLLNGIGHLPMVETPRVTARLLRRFWRNSATM
ncbi:MAG: alpha/beta fold hydrolase [Paraperlucidibaca sp.]